MTVLGHGAYHHSDFCTRPRFLAGTRAVVGTETIPVPRAQRGWKCATAHTERARTELDTIFSKIIFVLFDHVASFLFWFVQS